MKIDKAFLRKIASSRFLIHMSAGGTSRSVSFNPPEDDSPAMSEAIREKGWHYG
jgi:hypothetical protein